MRRLAPPLSDYSAREWASLLGFVVGPLLFALPFVAAAAALSLLYTIASYFLR